MDHKIRLAISSLNLYEYSYSRFAGPWQAVGDDTASDHIFPIQSTV
jgi:hypothetical protein